MHAWKELNNHKYNSFFVDLVFASSEIAVADGSGAVDVFVVIFIVILDSNSRGKNDTVWKMLGERGGYVVMH